MKNEQVKAEEKVQAEYWFLYKAANAAALLFALILFYNGHLLTGLFALLAIAVFNAVRVPIITDVFDDRMKHIVFKTQIENLYVVSEYADQPDTTVVATFKSTVNYLKEVGNKHEVRVHLIIFQDVTRFTWFWDAKGNLQKQSKPRDVLSSAETWDEYLQSVEKFKITDRDERLRQLRKDNAGFDWVNENVLWQQPAEN